MALEDDLPPTGIALTFDQPTFIEGSVAGTKIGVLSATDPEGQAVTFSVDPSSGFTVFVDENGVSSLVVADPAKLDYEADGGKIDVTVTATAGTSSMQTFSVDLSNLDEAPIGVSFTDFVTSIQENADIGTGIEIATVGVVDADAGPSTSAVMLLQEGDFGAFTLEPVGGEWKLVFTGGSPNYEPKDRYDVTIVSTGGAGPAAVQHFSLAVIDVNEAPTISLPVAAATIAENTTIPNGGIKVGEFTVEDDALGARTPSLGVGKDEAVFKLVQVGTSAAWEVWYTGLSPNFEAKASYAVDIIVADATLGATDTKTFDLSVTNVDEKPSDPALSATTANELAATGTVVGTLSASDPDAGAVLTFSLVNDAGGRFAIADGNKVVVKNGLLLDAEQAAAHQITVRVSDGLNTVDKVFSISVGDINPEFTAGSAANDVFVGGAAGDTLFGNLGNDRLVGGLGLDTLRGEAGNDEVRGGGGKDKLFGGDGNDTLFGDADTDTIKGDKGNDTLFGGLGNKDLLYGGLGKDAFAFDTKLGKTNVDTIKDFYAKDDKIFLDNAVFTKLGAGTLVKPKALSKGAFFVGTKAHDKDDRIVATKTKKGYDLSYDADGLGGKAQVKFGTIEFDKLDHKKFILTAADFFVI